jgi:hypothetical protein
MNESRFSGYRQILSRPGKQNACPFKMLQRFFKPGGSEIEHVVVRERQHGKTRPSQSLCRTGTRFETEFLAGEFRTGSRYRSFEVANGYIPVFQLLPRGRKRVIITHAFVCSGPPPGQHDIAHCVNNDLLRTGGRQSGKPLKK